MERKVKVLRFLTAGESHGEGLVGIIDGYPSGISINFNIINKELERRQKGYGRGGRMLIEKDSVKVMSGIRKGMTTGSPISFIIYNKDWENWKNIMDPAPQVDEESGTAGESLLEPRPGHADLTGMVKYRLDSIRDVIERSSARETAARVCVGGFAKIALKILGIRVYSYVNQIGNAILEKDISINDDNLQKTEQSEVRCPDKRISLEMIEEIKRAKKNQNTLGGRFKVIAAGIPPGLGSYSNWDRRLDGKIAASIMSIPAIKAIEIGEGFQSGASTGLDFHDEIYYGRKNNFFRKTNRAGGIEGGMTNGENIVIGATMKPIPTTSKGMKTVNIRTKETAISLKERSDICAVPSASIIGEAMLSIEILNMFLDKFGMDNIDEIFQNYTNYKKYIKKI